MIVEIIIILSLAGIIVIFLKKTSVFNRFKNFVFFKKFQKKGNLSRDKLNYQTNQKKEKPNFLFFNDRGSDNLLDKAEQLLKKGKDNESEKILLNLAIKNPRNAKIYSLLGVIYVRDNNYTDAKNSFNEAVKIDSRVASHHYNYAMACSHLGEFRNAIESMKKACKLDKKNKKYEKFLESLKKKVEYRFKEMKRTDD
jgi:predicted Zn-dependent protease